MTQGPYHLISIGLLLILIYFISVLMVRMQLISKLTQRKVWNYLLLIFFISTAMLGLMLAIKVNYKLNNSWIESAMQWHVELGIGFAFVALFHLSWHFKYYTKLAPRNAEMHDSGQWTPHITLNPLQNRLLFLLLGYISILAQLSLLREFIKTLHGNELVIGIFLALWMILTSTGAWAGARYRNRISLPVLLGLLLIMGSSTLVVFLLLILVDRILFLPGYEPGILNSMVYILLLISIFALISGFLFAYFSKSIKVAENNARNYMFDSLGSLLGGLLFGVILILAFNNIQIISFLLFTTVLALILVFRYPSRFYQKFLLLFLALVFLVLFSFPAVRNRIEGLRYKNELVLESRDTPYGNFTLTELDGQVTGYLDRNPVLNSADLARAEQTIHLAALQHPDPSSFLLMGDGLSGSLEEVIKYKPEIFDYCDPDPWIYRLGKKHLPNFPERQFNFVPMDGRRWLMRADSSAYDVIISAAPDPYTLGWNRFFTIEFFNLVSQHLTPGGIFCMHLSAGGNYINEKGSKLLSINYQTLKEVFENVLMVPGEITYFLASSQPLSLNIPAMLENHQIETTYVHPDFFDEIRLTFDSDMLMERLVQEDPEINRDMWPRLFFCSLSNLESRMGNHTLVVSGAIAVLIFLLLLFLFPARYTGMYVTGFTGAGIQIILIFVLQSLYGFAYMVAPLMITIFMAGIVLGTVAWKPVWRSPSPLKIGILLGIMALTDASGVILIKYIHHFQDPMLGQLLLGLLNFLPGIIVGSVYGMSVKLTKEGNNAGSGRLYSADLAGASLGSFIPVVFVLPLFGVVNTFILFCAINMAAGIVILARWR